MFHILFPLKGGMRRLVSFKIHELVDAVSFRVTLYDFLLMFKHAAHQIARHADLDRSTGTTCKDIDLELAHAPSVLNRDGRDKPGHDGQEDRRSGHDPADRLRRRFTRGARGL